MKQLLFVVCAFSVAAVWATPPAPYENYIELLTTDANVNENSMQNGAHWDGGAVPDDQHDYYVPNGKTIFTPPSSMTTYFEFPGRTLACGGYLANSTSKGFGVGTLYLLSGFDYQVSNNSPNNGGGSDKVSNHDTWIVKSTAEKPAKFSILWAYSAATITFYPKFVGDKSAFVTAYRKGNPYPRSDYEPGGSKAKYTYYTPDKMCNEMMGSFEEFFGTFQIATNTATLLTSAVKSVPGTIRVENGGHLRQAMTSGAFTIANLDLRENATVYFNRGKTVCSYTVTNSFVREAGKPFTVSFRDRSDNTDLSAAFVNGKVDLKLFTLTGPAAANAPDFSDVKIDAAFSSPVNVSLVVREEGDDKVVCLSNENDTETVYMIKGCGSSNAPTSAFYPDNGSYWSTGTVPSPEATRNMIATTTMQFFGYQSASQTAFDFPNTVYYAWPGVTTYCQALSMMFKEYHLLGDGIFYTYGGGAGDSAFAKHLKLDRPAFARSITMKDVYGPVYSEGAVGAVNTIMPFQGHGFRFKDDFRGTNTVKFSNINNHNNTYSYVALDANNTNFVGEMQFVTPAHTKTGYAASPDESADRYLSVMLSCGGNFGGAYCGKVDNAWRSVYVNGHTVLLATNDMAVVEPTRTFFLEDCARFYVASNKTFAIESDITLKGEFRKTGAGCLALGGAMRFNDATDSEPTADNNVLNVNAGSLMVNGVDAANGLAIAFAEDTFLAVDPESAAATSATGFKATRWATPFATAAADGKIAVALAPKATFEPGTGFTVALCTVPTAAAGDIAFRFVRYPHFGVKLRTVENAGDGTTTFFADYERKGVAIIVR